MDIRVIYPRPELRPFILRYEFITISERTTTARSLLFLPSFVNAFLFSYPQQGGIWLNNTALIDFQLPKTNLLAAVGEFSTLQSVGRSEHIRVIFAPGALSTLYRTPLHLFAGASMALEESLDRRIEQLYYRIGASAPNRTEQIHHLENYFLERLVGNRSSPLSLFEWFQPFFGQMGYHQSVNNTARAYGCTPRHLNRLLKQTLGFNYGKFRNLHRFNKALEIFQSQRDLRLGSLAHNLDYFDQAHFIREFKRLSGLRPLAFFKGAADQKIVYPVSPLEFGRSGVLFARQ